MPHKPQHPTPHTLSCRLVLSHHANLHPPRALPAGGGSWIRVPRQPDDWRWQLQPLPPQERHTHGVLPLHPCLIRHHPSPCLRHPAQTHHCGRPGLRLDCLLVAETGVGLEVGLGWVGLDSRIGKSGAALLWEHVTDMWAGTGRRITQQRTDTYIYIDIALEWSVCTQAFSDICLGLRLAARPPVFD